MRVDRVVGYTYRADIYCPDCIVGCLPSLVLRALDRRAPLDEGVRDAEAELNEVAAAAGIDRQDERSFDSGDFPKVLFPTDDIADDRCGSCHERIIDR